ncbi:hypothetical protein H4I96_05949 [Botrytis cinerea]
MNSMNPMGGYRRTTQSDIREMVEGADIQSPASAEFTEHVSEVVEDEEIGGAEKCAENVRPFKVGRKASFWRFKGKGDQRETDEVTPPVSGGLIDGSNSRAPDEAIGVKIGPSGGFPWFKRKGSERGQEKDKAKTKQKEESEEIDKMSPTTPVFFNSPSWSSESTSNGKWKAKENENEEQRRRNKSEGEVGLSKEVREGGKEEKKGKGRRWTLPWWRENEKNGISLTGQKYPDGVLDCCKDEFNDQGQRAEDQMNGFMLAAKNLEAEAKARDQTVTARIKRQNTAPPTIKTRSSSRLTH